MAFASHVVLAHFIFIDDYFAVFVPFVGHLNVIAARRVVLVGSGEHHTQFVVEETVAVGEAQVEGCLAADPVVTCSGRGSNGTFVGRVFGDEVDAAADGVGIHVRGYHFVYLNGLDHVGGDEVELNVARVAFGRRNAVTVDGD